MDQDMEKIKFLLNLYKTKVTHNHKFLVKNIMINQRIIVLEKRVLKKYNLLLYIIKLIKNKSRKYIK